MWFGDFQNVFQTYSNNWFRESRKFVGVEIVNVNDFWINLYCFIFHMCYPPKQFWRMLACWGVDHIRQNRFLECDYHGISVSVEIKPKSDYSLEFPVPLQLLKALVRRSSGPKGRVDVILVVPSTWQQSEIAYPGEKFTLWNKNFTLSLSLFLPHPPSRVWSSSSSHSKPSEL